MLSRNVGKGYACFWSALCINVVSSVRIDWPRNRNTIFVCRAHNRRVMHIVPWHTRGEVPTAGGSKAAYPSYLLPCSGCCIWGASNSSQDPRPKCGRGWDQCSACDGHWYGFCWTGLALESCDFVPIFGFLARLQLNLFKKVI